MVVEINSETDFVAKSEPFLELCHEVALQIAANSPPKFVSEEDIPPAEVIEAEKKALPLACAKKANLKPSFPKLWKAT